MNYFVTGIDTDSGKTLASAILCQALQADYWKPIQSGTPRDTEAVASLVSLPQFVTHVERFVLKTPASPHAAAAIDGVKITTDDFTLPKSDRPIIVEGAGGCLVPLNEKQFVIDLIVTLNLPVILVADLYLGSINHTLLTVEALKRRNIFIKGIVFNGDSNQSSESIILAHAQVPCLLKIKKENTIDKSVVAHYANELKKNWNG